MRILMLAQSFSPVIGGEERIVEDLSAELARRGHEVGVATLRQPAGEPPPRERRGRAPPARELGPPHPGRAGRRGAPLRAARSRPAHRSRSAARDPRAAPGRRPRPQLAGPLLPAVGAPLSGGLRPLPARLQLGLRHQALLLPRRRLQRAGRRASVSPTRSISTAPARVRWSPPAWRWVSPGCDAASTCSCRSALPFATSAALGRMIHTLSSPTSSAPCRRLRPLTIPASRRCPTSPS